MTSILTRTLAAAPGSYATAAEVRALTGLSDTNDIATADLEQLILTATLRFIGDVTIRLEDVELEADSTGKVFTCPVGLIADVTGDATIDGSDVSVRFVKVETDGKITEAATGAVTINSSEHGVIVTATALPNEYTAYASYNHYVRRLDLERAKRAVRYLAAHLTVLRVKAPGRITRADLTGIGRTEGETRPDAYATMRTKWLDFYYAELNGINGAPIF